MSEYEIAEQDVWKPTAAQAAPKGVSLEWAVPVVSKISKTWRAVERKVQNQLVILPRVEILNIPFIVRKGEELYSVESERWPSLVASGGDLPEAISEMSRLLGDVIEEYVMAPEGNLSEDAIQFRDYLLERVF